MRRHPRRRTSRSNPLNQVLKWSSSDSFTAPCSCGLYGYVIARSCPYNMQFHVVFIAQWFMKKVSSAWLLAIPASTVFGSWNPAVSILSCARDPPVWTISDDFIASGCRNLGREAADDHCGFSWPLQLATELFPKKRPTFRQLRPLCVSSSEWYNCKVKYCAQEQLGRMKQWQLGSTSSMEAPAPALASGHLYLFVRAKFDYVGLSFSLTLFIKAIFGPTHLTTHAKNTAVRCQTPCVSGGFGHQGSLLPGCPTSESWLKVLKIQMFIESCRLATWLSTDSAAKCNDIDLQARERTSIWWDCLYMPSLYAIVGHYQFNLSVINQQLFLASITLLVASMLDILKVLNLYWSFHLHNTVAVLHYHWLSLQNDHVINITHDCYSYVYINHD